MKEVRKRANMGAENRFYKIEPTDSIWWVEPDGTKDTFLFSFDKKKIYDLFKDYRNLTPEQKRIFDEENPFWCDFMNGNLKPMKE